MCYHFILVLFIVFSFFLSSCGSFNPYDDKINSNSDGSYVVESSLSDAELLDYGMVTIYRFQSVNNLIAVRQVDTKPHKNLSTFSNSHLVNLINQNTRIREQSANSSANNYSSTYCSQAYCEAGFENAKNIIKDNNINLNPIKIAVVDSGVLASTIAIKKILYASSNVTGNTNTDGWLPHATMISSIFAGVINSNNSDTPINVYAPNSLIHSIKITFSGDSDTSVQQQYGSMQLAVALDQAVACGANIVNLSLTYQEKPDDNIAFIEQGIMSAAAQKGVIFVAAAGNENASIDLTPVYPAAYDINNLIVAGSHNSNLQKAGSSNFGYNVDVSAQGSTISVNDKMGKVSTVGGTSFAVPLIASALSLYLGINNNVHLNPNQVLFDLFNSSNVHYNNNSNMQISNYGRLDAQELVRLGVQRSL